jgi:hypothetical protein
MGISDFTVLPIGVKEAEVSEIRKYVSGKFPPYTVL